MSAVDFLRDVVEPDVIELDQNYGDKRCAYHAVHSVDALAAHIFHDLKEAGHVFPGSVSDDTGYRHLLGSMSADFALLRDTAKALKHVRLTRGTPTVAGADQIAERQLGWGEGRWGEMRWDSPVQIVVETNAGDMRPVEIIVRNGLEFLKGQMQAHSLL